MDALVGQDGQVSALIVGVGGFLGAGEKDVAVSFNTVKATMKDNKILPDDEHDEGCTQIRAGLQIRPRQDGVGAGCQFAVTRRSKLTLSLSKKSLGQPEAFRFVMPA
jgi:hypothetical protein